MSFMLQLCLTLTGGAGLALQTRDDISKKTEEVTTLAVVYVTVQARRAKSRSNMGL
jgi:hypothetical protein